MPHQRCTRVFPHPRHSIMTLQVPPPQKNGMLPLASQLGMLREIAGAYRGKLGARKGGWAAEKQSYFSCPLHLLPHPAPTAPALHCGTLYMPLGATLQGGHLTECLHAGRSWISSEISSLK